MPSYEAKIVDGQPSLTETDIEDILHLNPARKHPFTREMILTALETLRRDWAEKNGKSLPPQPVVTSDHPPCSTCGGTIFLRTGTCHVCQTCGSSQGCS